MLGFRLASSFFVGQGLCDPESVGRSDVSGCIAMNRESFGMDVGMWGKNFEWIATKTRI